VDYLEKVFDRLRELVQRVVDALLGPDVQPEGELIPIPVNDRRRY
jgi:hypothetical protein